MLDMVLPHIRPLLASRQLSIDVEPDLPAIHIDLLRIEELLMNLVENVAKYSPQNPS
jgi:two-component system sensor histidine kinase KdpD